MKSTMDSIKDLQVEMRQWEGRLASAKAENDRLVRQNELLKQEDKNIRATLEQDAQIKLQEVRKATAKMNEEKGELERQKTEFLGLMRAYKQDKSALEQAKQDVLDSKKNMEALTAKAGAFVRLVKSAAEGL